MHKCNNKLHFFTFQAKIYKNIINYFIRKSVHAYAVAAKHWFSLLPIHVKFDLLQKFDQWDLIFTIKILAKLVKPIVTTITLFSILSQGYNRLSKMCTMIYKCRYVVKLIFEN